MVVKQKKKREEGLINHAITYLERVNNFPDVAVLGNKRRRNGVHYGVSVGNVLKNTCAGRLIGVDAAGTGRDTSKKSLIVSDAVGRLVLCPLLVGRETPKMEKTTLLLSWTVSLIHAFWLLYCCHFLSLLKVRLVKKKK